MSKAREYGWTGYSDTWETNGKVVWRMKDMKAIPKGKKGAVSNPLR